MQSKDLRSGEVDSFSNAFGDLVCLLRLTKVFLLLKPSINVCVRPSFPSVKGKTCHCTEGCLL